MPVTFSPSYRIPTVFANFSNLIVAESTRHGGVSPMPFASLNLGINTADEATNVDENRRRFLEAIGARTDRFASSYQVHGTEILHVTEPGRFEGYDALITNQPDLLIGVSIADCVPVLLYDTEHRAVAAIHAGWRGTVDGIVAKTFIRMQEQFGTQPSQCYAYIGTCIDAISYEVGPEVAEQFVPECKRIDAGTGKGYVDLKTANLIKLTDLGVPSMQIGLSPFSTVLDNDDYFSHRAERGQTGRMMAVIGLKG